jgi:hypothetical protein
MQRAALRPDDVRMADTTVPKIVHAQVLAVEPQVRALDLAIAVTAGAIAASTVVVHGVSRFALPVVGVVLRPPVVAPGYRPADWLEALARRGRQRRMDLLEHDLFEALDRVLPAVLEEMLRHVDLTDVVRRHVDLDAVVEEVDIDAIAGRLDLDAVVDRLDMDAVLDRLDLTQIVRERVDLDGVVEGVDLDAVAARLDIDAIVARLDLAGIAEDVLAAIDLPEIIREATGSVTSASVRGVRMRSISGDEAVGRVVDRFRLRRTAGASAASVAAPATDADEADTHDSEHPFP